MFLAQGEVGDGRTWEDFVNRKNGLQHRTLRVSDEDAWQVAVVHEAMNLWVEEKKTANVAVMFH